MRRVFSAIRRSLARRAIAFTSASVGLRNVSRSVSRTLGLAPRKEGLGISCNMSGSCMRQQNETFAERTQQKREAGFPPPLWSLLELRRFTGPGGLILSTVYSAAASIIGTTDTKVRPLAFARNTTWPSTLAKRGWSVA